MPRIPFDRSFLRVWPGPRCTRHPTRNATPLPVLAREATKPAMRAPLEPGRPRDISSLRGHHLPFRWNIRVATRSFPRGRKRVSDVFAGIGPAADGYYDVLLAVDHVGHRRTGLRSRHVDRADFLAGHLVVSAQHCAARMIRGRCDVSFTRDDKRLGNQCPDVVSGLARPRYVQTFQCRLITDEIRRFAMRNLPDKFPFIEIDGAEPAIMRLTLNESVDVHARETAASGSLWRLGRISSGVLAGTMENLYFSSGGAGDIVHIRGFLPRRPEPGPLHAR